MCEFVFPPVFIEGEIHDDHTQSAPRCVWVEKCYLGSDVESWTEYEVVDYTFGGESVALRFYSLHLAIADYRHRAVRSMNAPELREVPV
jgi:hypothetical protein